MGNVPSRREFVNEYIKEGKQMVLRDKETKAYKEYYKLNRKSSTLNHFQDADAIKVIIYYNILEDKAKKYVRLCQIHL